MLAGLELNSGGGEEAGRGSAGIYVVQVVVGWVDAVIAVVGVAVVAVAGQVVGVDQGTGTPIAVVAVGGQQRSGRQRQRGSG